MATSNPRRAPALVPMNGAAGAGLACGIFALVVAVGLGFWSLPFAVMAVLAGAAAIALGARGRAVGHIHQTESKIARAAMITGGLAMLLGLLGVVIR